LLNWIFQEYVRTYSGNLGGLYVKKPYSFGLEHIILIPLLFITQVILLSFIGRKDFIFRFYRVL